MTLISQDVSIAVDGSQMPAYLARPDEQSGPHPAIVVLQEVFGMTPEVRRVTDLIVSLGYVGLAINYYHRIDPQMSQPYTEEGNRNAFAAASRVTAAELNRDVAAAIAWLRTQPFVKGDKIATWGFGFGGTAAFVTSSIADLSAAICFYPISVAVPMPSGGEPPLEHVREIAIPMLVVYGEKDYYVSRFEMDAMHRAFKDAGKDVRMQIYPGVGHSFLRHGRAEAIAETARYSDEAVAQAVADSWDLVRAFLRDAFNRPRARAGGSGDIRTTSTESTPR